MAVICSATNHKGGVGKTSLVVNVATILAQKHKKKVLVIDLDQQCNCSKAMLGEERFSACLDKNAGEIFDENSKYSLNELIAKITPQLHIVPGRLNDLFLIERELSEINDKIDTIIIPSLNELLEAKDMNKKKNNVSNLLNYFKDISKHSTGWMRILQTKVSEIESEYDFIFFDLPPSFSRIPINAWTASHYLIVPISDSFALDGTEGLVGKMVDIMKKYNANLRFLFFYNKVLVTKNRSGEHISRNFQYIMGTLKENIEANPLLSRLSKILNTYIRYSRDIDTANGLSQSMISLFGNKSKVTKDYEDFTKELLEITK